MELELYPLVLFQVPLVDLENIFTTKNAQVVFGTMSHLFSR
jgi:hypothetical protein